MDCKKDVQIKFREELEVEAIYDFGSIQIKIDMKSPLDGIEAFTSLELQELPIKSAISRLQKLLEPTP